MAWKLKKPVALVGMMGSGKTAVGSALASRLHVPFVDSDTEIVRAANMAIPEIFARDGEAFFRAREAEVLQRLLDGPLGIISTGGGAFLSPANRAAIMGKGLSVWLRGDLPLLWERVRHRSTRPLLQTEDPKGTLARLIKERDPIYALADLAVDAHRDYSIDDMVDRVTETLLSRDDVLEAR
ncbi:MAG: shikimate kinase [Pseudomonadota bacterium]